MVHEVCRWDTTRGESLVAKVNELDQAPTFEREKAQLEWYRAHSELPVPRPMVTFRDPEHAVSGLVMAYVPGPNLAEAQLSRRGMHRVQRELADHVAALHCHQGEAFGPALEPSAEHTRWIDAFAPGFRKEFERVREQLSSRARDVVDKLQDRLERWLPDHVAPVLVHGDLWATNILVDDSHPDRPRILAFIDCEASYCDPEYELAYLRLFQTADQTFFDVYRRTHALRDGFEQRCRVYWLNTMLLHVRHFGEQYLPACEQLADQLRRLM